jgi:Rad3-related DNA helicase
MKIPYPSLASQKIKKRKDTNSDWYIWKTVVDIIQALGRSVRNEDDTCCSYILDSNFKNLIKFNGKIIPKYIFDAIINLK